MSFLTPLAFGLAALLPVIVALYFLKLRREEQRISSTYLWRTLVRDTAANAPWQRLRPNLLLLLQLLFLAALILALARPFTWSAATAGSHLILVADTSASMGATDVRPHRLAGAVATARGLVGALPASAQVTVIEAGAEVRVPVSGATDRRAALAALADLRPGLGEADMASALTLAAALAARAPESEVVVLSDGHVAVPDDLVLPCPVRYVAVGSESDNQAIGAFSVHIGAGGRDLTAFVQVANHGPVEVQRRLVLQEAQGGLVAVRDLTLAPNSVQAVTIPGLPTGARGFEAFLEGQDFLAADNRAWAVEPAMSRVSVQLVSTGNRFLETALGLLPNVEVTLVEPRPTGDGPISGQGPDEFNEAEAGTLTILDATLPGDTLPEGNLLVIAPPRSTEAFSVTGRLEAPVAVPLVADDPLLTYVDLQDVAIQEAAQLALPEWGQAALVDGKTNAPLLLLGEQAGRRLAVLAFDLRRSDLPLRVAFPLLLANLVDALAGYHSGGLGTGDWGLGATGSQSLAIAAPPQATAVVVRLPDGRAERLVPERGRAVLAGDNPAGIYELAWEDGEGRSHELGRLALNPFRAGESDITPRPSLAVAGTEAGGAGESPRAREEWWRPVAWAALALLTAEWLVAQRGRVAWILNAARVGLRRQA